MLSACKIGENLPVAQFHSYAVVNKICLRQKTKMIVRQFVVVMNVVDMFVA